MLRPFWRERRTKLKVKRMLMVAARREVEGECAWAVACFKPGYAGWRSNTSGATGLEVGPGEYGERLD